MARSTRHLLQRDRIRPPPRRGRRGRAPSRRRRGPPAPGRRARPAEAIAANPDWTQHRAGDPATVEVAARRPRVGRRLRVRHAHALRRSGGPAQAVHRLRRQPLARGQARRQAGHDVRLLGRAARRPGVDDPVAEQRLLPLGLRHRARSATPTTSSTPPAATPTARRGPPASRRRCPTRSRSTCARYQGARLARFTKVLAADRTRESAARG